MKKWILFGLSLLALTASLALSACGSQDQGGGAETTTPPAETAAPAATPTQPAGETGGTGTEGGNAPAEPATGGGQ